MRQGVIVSDNISEAENVTVTWESFDTSVPGTYNVTYTAADESGNTANAERLVRVVGSDEVWLNINGEPTTYMGTLVLNTGELEFEVGNLEGSNGAYEPYMLYVKKGFKNGRTDEEQFDCGKQ